MPDSWGKATTRLATTLLALLTMSCAEPETSISAQAAPLQTDTIMQLDFSALDGWREDDHQVALQAFRHSCVRILELAPLGPLDAKTGKIFLYGRAGDWAEVCNAARDVGEGDRAAREYFERWFTPIRLPSVGGPPLFTGYYEPEMKGALTRGGIYQTPVLAPPPGFIEARYAGTTGPSRAAIEAGALDGQSKILVWLADPVDAFFLHVQGSGRVRLEDGSVLRLGFAAKNGLPYTSISKVLIAGGELAPENVSMQTIRAWLTSHPKRAREVMQQNQSYIFFKILHGLSSELGPVGAEGLNLTPGRSIAVDHTLYPLGVPMWLDTNYPHEKGGAKLQRLMVAQDTGSAITGALRADIFWGLGPEAEFLAGHMKESGSLTLLLPRRLAAHQ